MTVRSSEPDGTLPTLVTKSQRAIELETEALPAAVRDFAESPQPGCPHDRDNTAWKQAHHQHGTGLRRLMGLGQHQARLMYANAYDHLVTMGRVLGSDGRMPLYAHTTLSRSVCEAAVRFSLLLDCSVSYETRVARSAAALYESVMYQLKGASEIPASGGLPQHVIRQLIDNSTTEMNGISKLIDSAGITRTLDSKGKKVVKLEMPTAGVSVPIGVQVGPLMAKLLPESPTWYNISSGTAHGATWVLRDAVMSSDPDLTLTPDLLEVAAATQSAISASALIIKGYGLYYGHDPEVWVRRSRQRRCMLDAWTADYATQQRDRG